MSRSLVIHAKQNKAVVIGAWAGMTAAVFFVLTFTIEGWLRSGYDARSMYVSELALGERGWVQNLNFIVTGLLLMLFARGVRAAFVPGRAQAAAPVLFDLVATGLFASGFFVMDPATTPQAEWSLHGTAHQLFGALVFASAPASCFVCLWRFWSDPVWRPLRWWTLFVGVLLVVVVVIMSAGPTMPPAAPNEFNAWIGLVQRTHLATYMAWIFSLAWWMKA